ncbi:unnamed protein product [Peronospora belbahrii]|nr:unnamed protein product [Peronospora belbahrii]
MKRKPSSTAASNASTTKRRRYQSPTASTASCASYDPHSKQESCHSIPSNGSIVSSSIARTSSSLTGLKLQSQEKKKMKVHAVDHLALFSRHADPTVQSPQSRVTSVSEYTSIGATLVEKRPSTCQDRQQIEDFNVPWTTNREVGDGVVDLTLVEHVARLEMVEGDDILQTLMRVSTPRVKRRFSSEKALTDSEQRDREILRRRRLKLRSQYSAMKDKQPCDDRQIRHVDFGVVRLNPVEENSRLQPEECEQTESVKIEDETMEGVEAKEVIEDEDETDEETTESKINRLSKIVHMKWRQLFVWLVSGAILLCAIVVAAPFVKKLMKPLLPYCDSEWTEVAEGSYVVVDPVSNFDRSKALQPFISPSSVATRTSEPVCQPCPVYGNCLNGFVISCASPYELQNGLCKESPEVQANVDQLARSIQKFVVEKASKSACGNVSLWRYLNSGNGLGPMSDVTASIEVQLSDVQILVTETLLFGKAVSNLPRDYVFNRALDMALRDLKDVFVTEDQSQLVVGGNVVPWSCRAKHQLYAYIKLIGLAVTLGTVLVFAYRQFLLYRTERQLVDRFVKEARFFLLDRTRRPDRLYPANHLRDDLFEKQSLQDRKWLCKSVWPKVAAVLKDDSRIGMRVMRVRGENMVVWEWASSSSLKYRRGGVNRSRNFYAASRSQEETDDDTGRRVPSRRRNKGSQMSL